MKLKEFGRPGGGGGGGGGACVPHAPPPRSANGNKVQMTWKYNSLDAESVLSFSWWIIARSDEVTSTRVFL